MICLRRPRSSRGVGHVEMHDLAAVMKQDHEHIKHAKRHPMGTTKKVDGDQIGEVVLEEGSPGPRGGFERRGMSPTYGAL